MYIKYTDVDKNIMYIPRQVSWKIVQRVFDDELDDDGGIYLLWNGEEEMLREVAHWCQGRPELRPWAVEKLYEEMVDVIFEKMTRDPSLNTIDIDMIEAELIESKYKQLWQEKEYITIDENGMW